ncbi:hypothetical protein [Blastococcus sp. CCUG 61487]|uniref:hypothetical protein n=1 Tax=Blastococcus sp. CCUG 61487 TaxID=1840703 RepID=UPI0010C0EC15|nr:hypothetical protein [Blastococcus sp. CCUG 61487]TKJ23435.1 hypothetical protein A6V29_05380 [Blastococcus sp. CCUG 61487]
MLPVTPFPPPPGPVGPPPSRRRAAWELGLAQGVYLLFLLPWFVLGVGGTMGLASWESDLAVLILLAWWIYPVVFVAGVAVSWSLFAGRLVTAARWVNLAPAPWVLLGLGLIVWILLAG